MNLKTLEKRIQEIKSKDPDAIDKDVKIYILIQINLEDHLDVI